MIKRFIKLTFIASIIGLVLSFGISEFFSYKINSEAKSYSKKMDKFSSLQDILAMCVGLYNANPTIDLKTDCAYILTDIYKVRADLLNNHPYTNFYAKYVNIL